MATRILHGIRIFEQLKGGQPRIIPVNFGEIPPNGRRRFYLRTTDRRTDKRQASSVITYLTLNLWLRWAKNKNPEWKQYFRKYIHSWESSKILWSPFPFACPPPSPPPPPPHTHLLVTHRELCPWSHDRRALRYLVTLPNLHSFHCPIYVSILFYELQFILYFVKEILYTTKYWQNFTLILSFFKCGQLLRL